MARKTLGKYEIIERIGRGGMAEVYRGYHAALDRYVAIKLLHPFLADDPEFKERFEREAKNVARLRHPNIVQVFDFDFDEEGESYYMVMELINGPTLKDKLFQEASNDQRHPLDETIRIIADTANALAYAHKRNMIHRDVKPANLMLDEDGRIVLTDFGIAKIVTGGQFTASGGMVGTPAYMAPEQGLGEAGDERSDIYSLGAIFYQMVTGRLPFDADTPLAVILKHVNDPLPDPMTYAPDLPKWIVEVIQRCLEKEAENRYQTADEFLEEMRQGLLKNGNIARPRSLLAQIEDTSKFSTGASLKPLSVLDPDKKTSPTSPPQLTTKRSTQEVPSQTATHKLSTNPAVTTTGRKTPKQETRRGWGLVFFAITLFVVSLSILGLVVLGQDGQGPLASFFADNNNDPTQVAGVTETLATITSTITSTDQPDPTATSTRRPTNTPTRRPSPTRTFSPTPTETEAPTSTPSLTRTPSPTANATETRRAQVQMTQTAIRAATQTIAAMTPSSTPTLTAREVVAVCQLDYVIIEPIDLDQPPSLSDTLHPRLQRAGTTFSFTIEIENASTCRWPLEGDLQLVFVQDTSDLEIDYSRLTRFCDVNPTFMDVNFSLRQRPRIFLEEVVDFPEENIRRGETFEFTFEAQAPDTRGCYFGAWQLEFTEFDATPIGDPIIIGIQAFGGS